MPAPAAAEVLAFDRWATNAHLIEDVARLGYLRREDAILDPTWGRGVFWKRWQPDVLVGSDLELEKSPVGRSVDVRWMPYFRTGSFDVVVFDPPYKLNGTGAEHEDRFGVAGPYVSRWERFEVAELGLEECARIARRAVLLKCQSQVNGGDVRWQDIDFTNYAAGLGLELVQRFWKIGHRPQPAGRAQKTARNNASCLLVFVKKREKARGRKPRSDR